MNQWPTFGFFFFFQAEDGIRDGRVTGVQTCALPISASAVTTRLSCAAPTVSRDCRRSPRSERRSGPESSPSLLHDQRGRPVVAEDAEDRDLLLALVRRPCTVEARDEDELIVGLEERIRFRE